MSDSPNKSPVLPWVVAAAFGVLWIVSLSETNRLRDELETLTVIVQRAGLSVEHQEEEDVPILCANDPLKYGVLDPTEGADFMYARFHGNNEPRYVPFSLTISVSGTAGEPLHVRERKSILDALSDIWLYDPIEWGSKLKHGFENVSLPETKRQELLVLKSTAFWETSSYCIARRVFDIKEHSSDNDNSEILIWGPRRYNQAHSIGSAAMIEVTTIIDGDRDPSHVSRRISYKVCKDDVTHPDCKIDITIPQSVQPALYWLEDDGFGFELIIEIVIPGEKGPERCENSKFIDYNMIYLPIKELLFGKHDSFDSEGELRSAFNDIINKMQVGATAVQLASELRSRLDGSESANVLICDTLEDGLVSAGVTKVCLHISSENQ